MEKIPVLFGEYETSIPREKVENQVDELSVPLNCPHCGQEFVAVFCHEWRSGPTATQCECGHVVMVRIWKGNQDYSLKVLAMLRDREEFIPMIFQNTVTGECMTSVCKLLAMTAGRLDGEGGSLKVLAYLWVTKEGKYVHVTQSWELVEDVKFLFEDFAVYPTARDSVMEVLIYLEDQAKCSGFFCILRDSLTRLNHDLFRAAAKNDQVIAEAMSSVLVNR